MAFGRLAAYRNRPWQALTVFIRARDASFHNKNGQVISCPARPRFHRAASPGWREPMAGTVLG